LAAPTAHPALPCPAAGLELVVYGAGFAARPSARAGYLLDLNTGPDLPEKVSFDPDGAAPFWYVIDRSVAARAGLRLHGRPAHEAIAEPDRPDLLRALRASVREHTDGEGHLADNRVLNGCRSVVFCRTGRWTAKRRAGRAVAETDPAFRPLIENALAGYDRPRRAARPLPAADVRAFLTWVAARVEETARASEDPRGARRPARGGWLGRVCRFSSGPRGLARTSAALSSVAAAPHRRPPPPCSCTHHAPLTGTCQGAVDPSRSDPKDTA